MVKILCQATIKNHPRNFSADPNDEFTISRLFIFLLFFFTRNKLSSLTRLAWLRLRSSRNTVERRKEEEIKRDKKFRKETPPRKSVQ